MATKKMSNRIDTPIVARPRDAAGHAAMARDHARAAAHHAAKAEQMANDARREMRPSQRAISGRQAG